MKCFTCKSVSYCDSECLKTDAKFHDGKVCAELKEDYYAALKLKRAARDE